MTDITWNEKCENGKTFLPVLTLFTPSGADDDHIPSSDQGVVSPTKDAVDFI